MALTLGQQLEEVQTSLSSARKAISSKVGDKELQRSYTMLLQEKEQLLKQIDKYGSSYIEGQNATPSRSKAFAGVSFG